MATDAYFHMATRSGLTATSDLNRSILEDWQDTMIERQWRPRTRSLAGTSARQFIRWAAERGSLDPRLEKAVATVKVIAGRPRPIPTEDLTKIKAYLLPRRPHMSIVALRDRALFFYLLTTGARVSEALQVRRDDLERPLVRQKGGTEKELLVPPAVLELVGDYVRGRFDQSQWLWISHRTNAPLHRLEPPGVREIWRKLARKLGLQPWTTHQLRHTCATELLEAGVSELVIAEHLGHHGLGSLHVYSQVRDRQRQEAIAVMQDLVAPPRFRLPRISRRQVNGGASRLPSVGQW